MSYKKSNVTGRTWSTPFNTPFFFRWGEWSIKPTRSLPSPTPWYPPPRAHSIGLDSRSDTDHVERPTVDQVAPKGVAVAGSHPILSANSEGGGEGSVAGGDKVADSNPRIDNAIYRIVKVSTSASSNLCIHMVEGAAPVATSANTDGSTTIRKLSEAIELLAGVGLLNLDTYATVFEAAAARACASGIPFWLKDPKRGYEVVV